MPTSREVLSTIQGRFFNGSKVSAEIEAEYSRRFDKWPPLNGLTTVQKERLTNGHHMFQRVLKDQFPSRGIDLDWTTSALLPIKEKGPKRDRIEHYWDGSIVYSIRRRGNVGSASIEYYLNGGDPNGSGTISTTNPIKVRMPEELAKKAPFLAMHQKLDLGSAREFAQDHSLPTGTIGVFGEATEENTIALLELSMGMPIS